MKLLILNWKDIMHPEAGGAERYVHAVARLWSADGHDVRVFTSRVAARPEREQLDGVTYLRKGSRTTTHRWARRFLHAEGSTYDHVLESVSTRPYFAHRLVGVRATVLYHQIADDVWHKEYPAPIAWVGRHLVERLWLRGMRDAAIVANSPSTAADLARFGVGCVGLAPPGCELLPHRPRQSALSHPPRLVYIGRLVRTKCPDHVLAAFRDIVAAFPGARLDIIGDGYLGEALRAQASPGVAFWGRVHDEQRATLLDACDLVLIPGTREGWGMVAIEAAALGVPVVAYAIPGLRDSVVDGVTGVLTEPTPAAMARGAIDLLHDRARWDSLSAAGQHRARAYTWRHAADSLMSAMLREPGSRGARPANAQAPRDVLVTGRNAGRHAR